ncbi:unnamed protein product [Ceratitis capitata]|uniref:(Mediterranean fruit fly) hypothetical protein n=1 Tax=Ceratitis capitata TaxID=7213 RepID=A0A811VAW8_CERCA|nr:unnamed protein product [Ceratitis capitata]
MEKSNQTSPKEMEPRRYQMELLNYVMNRNAVIYLPTGAGERDVDSWSRHKWEEEIKENQVLVGTAQIFWI